MQAESAAKKLFRKHGHKVADCLAQGEITMRQAIGLNSQEMSALADAAAAEVRAGKLKEASEAFALLTQLDPFYARAFRGLAETLQAQGAYLFAVPCFEHLFALGERTAADVAREAYCLRQLGEHEAADVLLRQEGALQ